MRLGARFSPLVPVLIALTLLRLAIAAAVPLVPDEAYYWVWSQALAPGYPDHPPMVALWIWLGTSLLGDGTLGVRLLGPLSVAAASLLLADAAACLLPGRDAGWRAAILLNATLLIGAGSVIMTPDAPLLAFWMATMWALARLVRSGNGWWWLAVGLCAGLAMASKYTAALLWFGIALWLLITPAVRHWLWRPATWCGALLGLAVFLPVVLWEADHGWPSFARQGGRIGAWHPASTLRFLGELIAGQAGLLTPLIFAFCIGGMGLALREAWRTREPSWSLLAVLTLPGAALFIEHTLGDRVQGNWPAIIYPAAAIGAAALQARIWQRLWQPAIGLGLAITGLAYGQAVLTPLPASIDPTARYLAGWDQLATDLDTLRRQTGASFIAADQYGVAAELARALPREVPVIGAGARWRLFSLAPVRGTPETGILIHNAGHGLEAAASSWPSLTEIGMLERRQGSHVVEAFRLYRVTLADSSADAVELPRPR